MVDLSVEASLRDVPASLQGMAEGTHNHRIPAANFKLLLQSGTTRFSTIHLWLLLIYVPSLPK